LGFGLGLGLGLGFGLAVRLEARELGWVEPRLGVRSEQQVALRLPVGRGKACAPAVLPHRRAAQQARRRACR
jgi:hypothetical protein